MFFWLRRFYSNVEISIYLLKFKADSAAITLSFLFHSANFILKFFKKYFALLLSTVYRSCDVSDTCQVLMDFVQSHFDKGRRLTGTQLVKAALKSKLCRHDVNELQIIVMHLLTTGYIR